MRFTSRLDAIATLLWYLGLFVTGVGFLTSGTLLATGLLLWLASCGLRFTDFACA